MGELLPCLYDKDIATNHVSQEGKAIGSIRLSVSILELIDQLKFLFVYGS